MTSLWLALSLLGQTNPTAGLLAANRDADLAAPGAAHPRRIDASSRVIFGYDWRQPTVRTGFFRQVSVAFGQPALSERHGLVILGTGEGQVLALRVSDASVAWTYEHGESFESAANLFELAGEKRELVVIGSRDGTLLALDAGSGALLWKAELEADVRAPGSQADDLIIVGTAKNQIIAIELRTGKTRWTAGRPAPTTLVVAGHARPLVHEGVVYSGFSDGYVEAYALADGGRKWSRPLSIKGGDFVDADADPCIADGRLYVASYSDGVYALDPKDGQTLWQRPGPAINRLALHKDAVVAGSGDGWVWGVRPEDGSTLFRTRLEKGMVSRFAIRDDLIVFGAGDSGLVVLDARSGKPLQATSFGTRMQNDPAWRGDEIAMLSATGYLYSFSRAN